ncbi:uncharacterized protein LOC112183719 isoform X1 [Rosa chinensis]|nr:uncharacterized protein LOC112183719 isoform X1 [Rosa chinensis]
MMFHNRGALPNLILSFCIWSQDLRPLLSSHWVFSIWKDCQLNLQRIAMVWTVIYNDPDIILCRDSCICCENWPQTCRSPAAGVLKDCQVAMNAITEDVACYAMLREVHSGGSEQLGCVSNRFILYYP